MMYQTAPEDDYGECPSSRTDSSYGWGWPATSILGHFSIFFEFFNSLISEAGEAIRDAEMACKA